MKPMNPKKRWLAESSQDEPDAETAEEADNAEADERVSDAAEGVGRLTIDLEPGEQPMGQLVTSATPPTPSPQPSQGPPHGFVDLGRLQPGQNALITAETLITRVTSVVPVSEASSSAGSSPFRYCTDKNTQNAVKIGIYYKIHVQVQTHLTCHPCRSSSSPRTPSTDGGDPTPPTVPRTPSTFTLIEDAFLLKDAYHSGILPTGIRRLSQVPGWPPQPSPHPGDCSPSSSRDFAFILTVLKVMNDSRITDYFVKVALQESAK